LIVQWPWRISWRAWRREAGEAEADQDVVEAPLEQGQQVLARDPRLAAGLLVVVAELLLQTP
jgi:hypothetical protein